MKKKILALCLVIVLTVATAVGTTLAYFSDTDEDINVMTVGSVSIDQFELERVAQTNGGNDALRPYTQNKPLYPSVGERRWIDGDAGRTYQSWPTGGSSALYDTALKNVVDKFVFVENDGRSDAYVRSIFAFEAGDLSLEEWQALFHLNLNTTHWVWSHDASGFLETQIDGVRYFVTTAVYQRENDVTKAVGVLSPGETTRPSLLQYDLDGKALNEDIAAMGDSYEVLVISQAVQTDGFQTAGDALNAAFGFVDGVNAKLWFERISPRVVSTDAQLKAALEADQETIYISLAADVTYDVSASDANAMGGASTRKIVISGNGHTLTFNQLNSDWNHVTTANGAKLVLKDLKLTNTGHNNGPWNRHDINFACKVELSNVTSDKAIALGADSVLRSVTITENGDVYGLWIKANGSTVKIDGLTIKSSRGIKIADEYIDAPAEITLTVQNAVFKTTNKAAILVTSTAGADITLENVDITGCAADKVNAVWVDEDRASYAGFVTVTGGSVVVEPNTP